MVQSNPQRVDPEFKRGAKRELERLEKLREETGIQIAELSVVLRGLDSQIGALKTLLDDEGEAPSELRSEIAVPATVESELESPGQRIRIPRLPRRSRRSALDAAYQVLLEAGEPLHYVDLTQRMIDGDFWSTSGLTPENTVNSQIVTEIARRGPRSRFQRVGRGYYEAVRDRGPSKNAPPAADSSERRPGHPQGRPGLQAEHFSRLRKGGER